MRPCSPEAGNGRANLLVILACVGVDVTGVSDLALGGGVDAVDLGAGEGLEGVDAELLRQGVDASVLEELVARVIDGGGSRVVFEDALARELLGEVLARVEELEEAAYGVDVLVGEVYLAGLGEVSLGVALMSEGAHASVGDEALADLCEVWALCQQRLMRRETAW